MHLVTYDNPTWDFPKGKDFSDFHCPLTALDRTGPDAKLKSYTVLLRNGYKPHTFFAENISKPKETDEQTEDLTGYLLVSVSECWNSFPVRSGPYVALLPCRMQLRQ